MKFYLGILCILSSYAFSSEYNGNFDNDPLNLKWEASVNEVKEIYPDGLIWPNLGVPGSVSYSFSKSNNFFWLGIPVEDVKISFSKNEKLKTIFLQFKYSERDKVLKKSLEVFGAGNRTNEKQNLEKYSWVKSKGPNIWLSINNEHEFEWVYLAIDTASSN